MSALTQQAISEALGGAATDTWLAGLGSGEAEVSQAQVLSHAEGSAALDRFAAAPVLRHDLPALLAGAWAVSAQVRVTDALYIELASRLGLRVLTSDARLARASGLVTLVE